MNKKVLIVFLVVVIITVIFLSCMYTGRYRKANSNNEAKKSSITLKVDSSEYERYIFVGGSNEEYISRKIEEYLVVLGIEGTASEYFTINKYNDAYRVEVQENVDFYLYHNMISWIAGFSKDNDSPKYTVGVANNHELTEASYLCFVENTNVGDTLIGKMEYGDTMFIYLPDSFNDCINIIEEEYHIFKMDKYLNLMKKDGVVE